MATACSGCDGDAQDPQGPGRQPWRDRAAGVPHLPRSRDRHRRGLFRRRRRRVARRRRRRGRAPSRLVCRRDLPRHPPDHRRCLAHRRGRSTPRLRLPFGKRRVRARLCRRRPRLHRSAARGDRRDGLEAAGQEDDVRRGGACAARWRHDGAIGRAAGEAGRRRRLPRAGQGQRRRRWPRHAHCRVAGRARRSGHLRFA